jgi:prepilin-type N-terminal cleavage/methylation domain-containing protein
MFRPKGGFTLVELLVVIAVMATMVSVCVVSVRAGQDAARVRGAARNVFAAVRQTRSIALVTQQPAVITLSTDVRDGAPCAKIEIHFVRLVGGAGPATAETLSGRTVRLSEEGDAGGESVEDVLFAPLREEVAAGIRLKVLVGDEALDASSEDVRERSKISVFSTSDYILGRFRDARERRTESAEEEEAAPSATAAPSAGGDDDAPRSLVWEVNGRCEPHRIWVYADGSRPEDGYCIAVDRFGAAKVLEEDER